MAAHGGLLIEVGPCPQGLLRADVFEETRQAVATTLDFLASQAAGEEPDLPGEVPCFEFVERLSLPEDDDGNLIGMIHPALQDADFRPLRVGDPLFLLETGETVAYEGEAGLCPTFVNEAAYYDQHTALLLTRRSTLTVS